MKPIRCVPFVLALLSASALADSTYTVKAGDTLYRVAKNAHLEPEALLKLNGLGSSTLQVGQVLKLGGNAAVSAPSAQAQTPARPAPAIPDVAAAVAQAGGGSASAQAAPRPAQDGVVRAAATRFLGIRYALGGTGRGSIDCSGYTRAVLAQLGINLPRTARAQFGAGRSVARGDLRAGDLVFFNTMGRGVSHVGLYVGGGQFANANSYHGRTMIESMGTAYWASRYVGARRFLPST